jgi:hypothetical protein
MVGRPMPNVTRVVVRQQGKERKLLKITEGAKGQLSISGDVLNFPLSPYGGEIFMKDKLSVHLSENAKTPMRFLHATQTLPGGIPKDVKAALPIFSDKKFIYPVMARIVGNLDNSGYDLVEQKGEIILPLKGYSSQNSTMLIFCMITEPDVTLPALPGLRKTIVPFSKFTLVFYHTFAPYGTPLIPIFYNFSTTPPVVDGVPLPGSNKWIESPVPLGAVNSVLTSVSEQMIDSLLGGAAAYHKARNEPVPYPPRAQWQMGPTCAPFDQVDIEYGIHGNIVASDNFEEMFASITKRVAYSKHYEGTVQNAFDQIDALLWAEWFTQEQLDKATGGNLIQYLEETARRGVTPTC